MDLDEAITVTKLDMNSCRYYLIIGWHSSSFEMYLLTGDKVWKGKFSSNRLAGFSKNLNVNENSYLETIKKCLTQQREDYLYELKSGFFYWKRKYMDSVVIEGFLPVNLMDTPDCGRPDLIEILLALNNHLKHKLKNYNNKFKTLKTDYEKCLKDTEEFLNLKIDMERALCDKFMNLLCIKKNRLENERCKDKEVLGKNKSIYNLDMQGRNEKAIVNFFKKTLH